MRGASQLKTVSRILSVVGRRSGSSATLRRRPRHFPATIRTRPGGAVPECGAVDGRLLMDLHLIVFGRKNKSESESGSAPREGFVKRLRARLNRGNSWLTYDLANLIPGGKIDEDVLEDLESRLIMADVGVAASERIIDNLRKRLARKELQDVKALTDGLRKAMTDILSRVEKPLEISSATQPFVILVVGVNGAGKTTTIGKLAKRFRDRGISVMLAAGDTFRAAAIEQLKTWGERHFVPVISQQHGADPAAVIFDAFTAARSRGIDVLIADTAGRLQSQQGLMDELTKIKRVLARHDPDAPHEILLVLDAGLGQNAMVQAEKFHAALGLTGIAVTKLDGTAKGGILLAIADRFGIPVRFIGIGEAADDMQPFEAAEYVDALLRPDGTDEDWSS
jgi:fused signal recognition particle receptor